MTLSAKHRKALRSFAAGAYATASLEVVTEAVYGRRGGGASNGAIRLIKTLHRRRLIEWRGGQTWALTTEGRAALGDEA
jgi:uncharacterized protein YjhX (UPF0386 family)